jgi:hypothetical protein
MATMVYCETCASARTTYTDDDGVVRSVCNHVIIGRPQRPPRYGD